LTTRCSKPFITEHSKAVYYLALRILSDPTQAEDAAHDVFIKAFRNLKQFRGDAEIRTWLYRITINHCQNIVKSWHHRKMVNNVEEGFLENSSLHNDSPLEVLEGTELGERIQETLNRLPEEYRLLLLLVADQHLTYEQIGQLTNQSGDAVRGKLHGHGKRLPFNLNKRNNPWTRLNKNFSNGPRKRPIVDEDQQQAQKQNSRQFADVEALIQFDAAQTTAPSEPQGTFKGVDRRRKSGTPGLVASFLGQ